MLLVCQILNMCNYEVLFGLIFKNWSLANVTQIQKITVHNDLFHLVFSLGVT